MQKLGLIIGIDPGTTTAWSIFDVEGNLLQIGSQKGIGLDELIRIIHSFGKVYAVGCDKKHVPGFILAFARKLGCKIISPKEDMTKEHKHDLAKEYDTENHHELDAVASGEYAKRQLSRLITKIRIAADNEQVRFDHILNLVFDSGMSIAQAVSILDQPLKQSSNAEPKNIQSHHVVGFLSGLNELHKQNRRLKIRVSSLQSQFDSARLTITQLQNKLKNRPKQEHGELLRLREQQILLLSNQVGILRSTLRSWQNKTTELEKIITDIHEFTVCKCLKNLGMQEFKRITARLNVKMGDILFVENPYESSEEVIKILQEIGVIICTQQRINKNLRERLGMGCVSIQGFEVKIYDFVVLIKKQKFEEAKQRSILLDEIIEQYQSERARITQ